MADTFRLQGSFATTPLIGLPSGFPSLTGPITEITQLDNKATTQYLLTTDLVQTVDLCGLASVAVLIVKVVGGKVRMRVTSTDGTLQAIPIDGFFALLSLSVPITAIDLLRSPGVETTVQLFMGELV